jgi:predicted secreted protein
MHRDVTTPGRRPRWQRPPSHSRRRSRSASPSSRLRTLVTNNRRERSQLPASAQQPRPPTNGHARLTEVLDAARNFTAVCQDMGNLQASLGRARTVEEVRQRTREFLDRHMSRPHLRGFEL